MFCAIHLIANRIWVHVFVKNRMILLHHLYNIRNSLKKKDDSDPAVVSSSAGQHTDVKQWAETTRDFP